MDVRFMIFVRITDKFTNSNVDFTLRDKSQLSTYSAQAVMDEINMFSKGIFIIPLGE